MSNRTSAQIAQLHALEQKRDLVMDALESWRDYLMVIQTKISVHEMELKELDKKIMSFFSVEVPED